MRDEHLPFSRPDLGEEEIAAVVETLRSGWITTGPRSREFEERFAEAVGAREAVAVSSCTAGFQLVLHALDIGPGDEVVCASLSWPSPASMVALRGARPVFADVDPGTLLLDPSSVASALSPRTRAVIPVHFAGQPCDLEALRELCRKRGAYLIEDAAHAAGSRLGGQAIGGGEDLAVFSFHPSKTITTGEGGMVTTHDADLATRLRSLRFHGVDRDAWSRHGRAGGGYDLLEPGWKHNLTDLQAALGIVQLKRLESMRRRREELAKRYDQSLVGLAGLEIPRRVSYRHRHAWHLYTVLVDPTRGAPERDTFREELHRRHIGTGYHFPAVHELSYYRQHAPAKLPATESAAARICSLPLFSSMTARDVDDVVEAIKDVLSQQL